MYLNINRMSIGPFMDYVISSIKSQKICRVFKVQEIHNIFKDFIGFLHKNRLYYFTIYLNYNSIFTKFFTYKDCY